MTGLPPRTHPLVRCFLADEAAPTGLLARWGSPLNVLFPEIFAANVAGFRDELDATGLQYRICYAHKANQGRAFVRAALAEGIGIDVASPGELRSALAAGFPASRIEATGPKGRDFLGVLAGSGVTVNADNLWELAEIIRLARAAEDRTPVLVRMCGFGPGTPQRPSRFGVPLARFEAVTDLLAAARDAVDFLGLSFHLDSSTVSDRVLAVDTCLRLLERAWAAGLSPRILDVGGGFRQAFADRPEPFDEYGQAVKRGLAGRGHPLTWGGATLGYRYEDGGVRGTLISGKYAGTVTGRDFLRELTGSPLPGQGGRTIARVLRENMIELWLEPGKSLVDHAGLTLASVEFVKEASDGSVLVNLDISRDKICPADQEVMLDPVLIYRSPARRHAGHLTGVFFAGNLCLERDMIFTHLTFVDRLPEPGDIVAFVNTAGYQMDLSASAALMQRQPAKVVARATGDGFTAHADTDDQDQESGPCFTSTSPS
jgi:diaminopimelate decarboxylase